MSESAPVTFEDDERGGVTVLRDGHPQSHVDLRDPGYLAFEYVAQIALALDALAPPGRLAVTHVGGAGLTLPRYITHTRPGSTQIVLEPDEALTAQVRARLPLPRASGIRVRATDGLTGVAALNHESADVVIVDAYAGGRVPAPLVGPTFLGHLARVLRPGGLALLNLADDPGLPWVARVTATLRPGLPHLCLLGTPEVVKGRRFGNAVLVASATPYDVDEVRRHAARCPHPTGVRGPREVGRLAESARPFTDEDAQPSPEPPTFLRRG